MPARGAGEPTFRSSPTSGNQEHVLPGNKEFSAGDRISKPDGGAGSGGGHGAGGGGSDDDFQFILSREVLDLFFEDLELPDLVKLSLKETVTFKPQRVGFTTSGSPTNINIGRTMRNSFGRRMYAAAERAAGEAHHRRDRGTRGRDPIIGGNPPQTDGPARRAYNAGAAAPTDFLCRSRRRHFNRFERQPVPNANAVMFCLMDVSASMGEREKDLAKRFFVLLHLFLKRRYGRIDIIFIRHTDEAHEVGEETFFYSKQSGGTVVSTALEEMQRIIEARYPSDMWNIYAAQAWTVTTTATVRAMRGAPARRPDAALPVLRLCRDHRQARDGNIRRHRQRHLAVARLPNRRGRGPQLSHGPHRKTGQHLSSLSQTLHPASRRAYLAA